MDSVLILCNHALSLDDKSAEAYTIVGDYYSYKGNIQKAIDQYNKAIAINPNLSDAYLGKGFVYEYDDHVNSIDNYQKAASINHGLELPELLRTISMEYISAGFIDKAKYYNSEAFNLDADSAKNYDFLGSIELLTENYHKALEYLKRGFALDSSSIDLANDLAYTYMFQNDFRQSLKYFKKDLDTSNLHRSFIVAQVHHIGWAYWENGQRKKAEYYFNKQLEYSKNEIMMKRPWGQKLYPYYDMAGVYAIRGDKEKAYKYLRLFNMRKTMPFWILSYMKNDPLFNSMRREADFQQIAKEIENKYLSEHNRVKKWMTENNM
jgi:tetratricopeptide (TPR) repeat protein